MGDTYTVSMDDVTIIANATLVFINPDTDVGIEVLRFWAGQAGSATSGQIMVRAFTQVTAFPTVTSQEPVGHDLGAVISKIVGGTAGAAGTCGVDASANGAGAQTDIMSKAGNNIVGVEWLGKPEENIILPRALASGFGIRVVGTPASLTNWSAGVTYREI